MLNADPGSRVRFIKGRQGEFLEAALLGLRGRDLAKTIGVCDRTLRDWKREKYNIDLGSLKKICFSVDMETPRDIEILQPHWSVKKACILGGRRYVELYGAPGTLESRRKGGRISQEKHPLNAELAKKSGFVTRKKVKYPGKSAALAEFIGIMLGDGGIRNDYQLAISFNLRKDMKYAYYIQDLVSGLFGISSTIREKCGGGDIVVSGRNLVEFLIRHGLKKGNKVAQRIDLPKWIWESEKYKIACLRGLMDTDGGLYHHKYKVNGKEYTYLKMCFTSYSPPLLKSVIGILEDLGLGPKNTVKNRVYLYSINQIDRYFRYVGSSNPRYFNIYKNFVTPCK